MRQLGGNRLKKTVISANHANQLCDKITFQLQISTENSQVKLL